MLHNRVRELRIGRDETQDMLAAALDVSRQTVSSIETGRYEPSLRLGLHIAKHFGLAVEEVFHDRSDCDHNDDENGYDDDEN